MIQETGSTHLFFRISSIFLPALVLVSFTFPLVTISWSSECQECGSSISISEVYTSLGTSSINLPRAIAAHMLLSLQCLWRHWFRLFITQGFRHPWRRAFLGHSVLPPGSLPGSQCTSSRKPSTSPNPQGFSFPSEFFGLILLILPDLPPPLLSLTALQLFWTPMQIS